MAVLLMIIATIAISALVWMYASSQAQTLSRSASIEIVDAQIVAATGGDSGKALVGVKNTGSVAVTITKVEATDPAGGGSCTSFTTGTTINPGDVAYFSSTCTGLQPGKRMTIIVEGSSATNEKVSALGLAVVM